MYKEISLADAVEFVVDNRGKTVPVEESGFPLIATNCISNENLYPEFNNVRYVSDETYQNWFRSHPKPYDIILTNKGSKNGAICLVPDPVNFCIAQDMVALRAKKGIVYPKYLFAVLRSSLVQNRIKELNVDSVIPHFKKTDFNKLFFPLPNYERQIEIGDCFYNYCQKIELNRQTNQTLEQIAQAIFKSWFVDFEPTRAKIQARASIAAGKRPNSDEPLPPNFTQADQDQLVERAAMAAISGKSLKEIEQLSQEQDVHGHTNVAGAGCAGATLEELKTTAALFPEKLVDSQLGEIPEGWRSGTLDKICDLNKQSWTKKNAPKNVCYVDLANTKNGVIEDLKYFSWKDAPSRAKRILNKGDTIIGTVRPGNRSFSIIGKGNKQLTASTGFAVLTPNRPELTEFLFIASTSDENIDRLAHLADGGAYPAVRPDVVTSMKTVIPSDSVMLTFSELIKPMFKKRQINLDLTDTYTNLRDALLPKLLSGELKT